MIKIDVVIFDLDGTLVLLPINWEEIMTRIRSIPSIEAKSFLGFVARYHGSTIFWDIHRYLEDIEITVVDNLTILDDADKMLQNLCQRIPIGFITMQSRSAAKRILVKLGIDKCKNNLGILSTREDASNRVEQLAKAIKTSGIEPSKVLFIGDKVLDAIAAIVNKVNSILILRNAVSMRISSTDYLDEDLEVLGVYVVSNLFDAFRIIKEVYNVPIDSTLGDSIRQ